MRFFDRVWRCAFVDWGTRISIQWIRIGMVRASCLSIRGGLLCGKFHFHTQARPINSLGLVAVPLIGGALFTSSFALIYSGPPTALDKPTLWALILLAIFPTTFAAYLRDGLIRSAGPVFMSLSNYMVPVWSVIFGIILLNESLSLPLILALLLILFGTLLSQIDALKSLFSNITGRNRKIT